MKDENLPDVPKDDGDGDDGGDGITWEDVIDHGSRMTPGDEPIEDPGWLIPVVAGIITAGLFFLGAYYIIGLPVGDTAGVNESNEVNTTNGSDDLVAAQNDTDDTDESEESGATGDDEPIFEDEEDPPGDSTDEQNDAETSTESDDSQPVDDTNDTDNVEQNDTEEAQNDTEDETENQARGLDERTVIVVVDEAGNPIQGATVTFEGIASQTTGVNGQVSVVPVSDEAIIVTIEADGFQSVRGAVEPGTETTVPLQERESADSVGTNETGA